MPTTVLGLLGVLLCALAVSSGVTPQPDFSVKRVAGKWYLIGIASNTEWFVTCKADMKMGVAMLTPTDEGDLEMAYSSLNPDGTSWRINQLAKKTNIPGKFSYRSERWKNDNDMRFVDVKCDEFALIHTVKTKADSTTVVSKLYGRTPHLSQVVLDKFTAFSRKQGILPENIAILSKNAMSIPGGFTPEKVVTPEVEKICLEVHRSQPDPGRIQVRPRTCTLTRPQRSPEVSAEIESTRSSPVKASSTRQPRHSSSTTVHTGVMNTILNWMELK